MTWGEEPSASTPAWSESTSTTLAWNAASEASALGNRNRFVQAFDVQDASGGVDFAENFSVTNPFAMTASAPISFSSTNREHPA